MVGVDRRLRSRIWDAVAGRKALLSANRIFFLSPREKSELVAAMGEATSLEHLVNGVPIQSSLVEPAAVDVLYCARIHERKRPLAFVEAAKQVIGRGYQDVSFSIVGPDEGDLPAVLEAIRETNGRVRYEGSLDYDKTAARMAAATAYVLPSVDDFFPMSLLEALSLGVPSVCTEGCGVAAELHRRQAAIVTDGSVADLADAMEAVIVDPLLRARLRENGRRAIGEVYGIEAVANQLERAYEQAVNAM
jgi:glycosyltransferase involved in cell wall biosynthesis